MHISYQDNGGAARAALAVEAESGEASPNLSELLFDVSPVSVSATQAAVAGALLYGSSALKRLKVNGEMLNVDVASLSHIIELPVDVDSVTASESQQDVPLRQTMLRVSMGVNLANNTPGRDETNLNLVPSERYFGGLLGIKEAVVASNAWLHATYVSPVRVLAATGVLFAHDFLAHGLVLPETTSSEKDIINRLCRVVGLETTFGATG